MIGQLLTVLAYHFDQKTQTNRMKYQQLTYAQRYQIFALYSAGYSLRHIARLGKAPSTISREIKRNGLTSDGYDPENAQQMALKRRQLSTKRCLSDATLFIVKTLLSIDWSPDQIAKISQKLGLPVSHECIYQLILKDFKSGGTLHLHLRHRLKRYRRRLHKQRGRIVGRRSIHLRPNEVNKRLRCGDWEVDTVIGRQGTGAIVTLLERKTRTYLIKKVPSKCANVVADAIIDMLQPLAPLVHTITSDNGLEFAEHQRIANTLKTEVYFADPYASYQRGANENANGLLRQYVPKGTDLRTVSDADLAWYQRLINFRPRKILGYHQPAVLFKHYLTQAQAGVAVIG